MSGARPEDHAAPQPDGDGKATEGPPKKRKRRWGRRILLALLLLAVAGELGLRGLAHRYSTFDVALGNCMEWDAHRGYRLRKNYRIRTNSTNSKGMLGPEFDATRSPGSLRVVTLGDSCSFLPVERNYPAALTELLQKRHPKRRVEIINASCPGYDSTVSRTWYEREIDGYDHDVLVIYLGWNDMGRYHPEGRPYDPDQTGSTEQASPAKRALLKSHLLRVGFLMMAYWLRSPPSPISTDPLNAEEAKLYGDYYPEHFEENLTAIIKLAQSRHRRIFLLDLADVVTESPTPDEQRRIRFSRGLEGRVYKYLAVKKSYTAALTAAAEKTDTPIIDIASLFSDVESRKVFTDTIHFTPEGSEKIAARVAERLSGQGPTTAATSQRGGKQ